MYLWESTKVNAICVHFKIVSQLQGRFEDIFVISSFAPPSSKPDLHVDHVKFETMLLKLTVTHRKCINCSAIKWACLYLLLALAISERAFPQGARNIETDKLCNGMKGLCQALIERSYYWRIISSSNLTEMWQTACFPELLHELGKWPLIYLSICSSEVSILAKLSQLRTLKKFFELALICDKYLK